MCIRDRLKSHKDEIRILHVRDNILFSAGKGGASYGAMCIWDLRQLGQNTAPIEEREKNQDIFALRPKDDILFYGSRNHQVRRLDLRTMEAMSPFEPPHFDTVTSLALVNDYLVSGSRDKNLKLWRVDTAIHNLKFTAYAHQDWINTLESDDNTGLLYSGSRDGRIKVWCAEKEKLRCLNDLNSHQQAVNSIIKLENSSGRGMFASGSADRTIKIWRMNEDLMSRGPLINDDISNRNTGMEVETNFNN
eukprot:TRINITY_DN6761_c0_g1_i7.p1 TRINITY_DN6761_c0_g1~~TRINITY_DN6761_c0_g1_i7.p1  ORF type:complete len:267 (+),score=58.19 TRINITY_DN6761_c0_g1_i7:59-802(+)